MMRSEGTAGSDSGDGRKEKRRRTELSKIGDGRFLIAETACHSFRSNRPCFEPAQLTKWASFWLANGTGARSQIHHGPKRSPVAIFK